MTAVLRRLILTLGFALSLNVSASTDSCHNTRAWDRMAQDVVHIESGHGRTIRLNVRIADDANKRAAGYQHICPDTIQGSAILFIFDRETRSSFHMRNVHAPLDIAFLDASGRLLEVLHMVPDPGGSGRSLYTPAHRFQYALEVPAGFFADAGLSGREWRLVR